MVMSSRSASSVSARCHHLTSEDAPASPSLMRPLLTVTKIERTNNDANDQLSFQQHLDSIKVQGRALELDDLRKAYDRVSRHKQTVLVLVHGVSGCGKKSLIEKFRSTLPEGCISAEGKFDHLSHSDAFDVIINACNQLCSFLTETNSSEIRTKLSQSLGVQATVLSKQMPALAKLLTGSTHDSSRNSSILSNEDTLEPMHADHARIKGLYQRFLNCIRSCYTVVLFFNDLQWSDDTSRSLIQALASDSNSKSLLIIGAYQF